MTASSRRWSSAEPLVSVVIPTYRREDLLRRSLRSILAQDYPRFEVIVVDQDAERRLTSLCSEELGDPRTVYVNIPRAGLSAARNHGMSKASGELLLFIDDDARARDGWMAAFVELFQQNPEAGLATGGIIGDWEAPPPDWFPMEYSFLVGHYELDQEPGPLPEGHLPPGGNLAGPADLIRSAGGFDERFGYNLFRKRPFLAGEDTLLGLRLERAGWGMYYCTGAVVDHLVAARKLQRRQFARRNFWEGVTAVELRRALGDTGSLGDALRWHGREMCMAAARYLLPGYEDRYALTNEQIRMMSLRRIAHNAGALYGRITSQIEVAENEGKGILRPSLGD